MTFAWAADSKSVVASPKTALVLNKTYSVVVSTFAKNSSGSAALSVPFVSKVVVQENSSTSGTLMPGGSWTSRDGVVISAKPGVISQPINVFAEPIQPLQFPLPMPEGVDPIGQAFRVGTKPKTVWAKGNFDLLIPGPTRASGEDIRLYAFTPFPFVNQPEDIENGGVWGESTAKSNTLNQYATYDGALSPYATIFAFGRVRGSVKSGSSIPVIRTFSNPINEVECIGDLQKNDNELCPSDKNAVLQKLNNVLVDLKFDLGVTSDAFEKLESPLRIVSTLQGRCAKTDAVAFYDSNKKEKNITLCYSLSKKTFGTDEEIIETLRHEVFHAIQYNYWQINEVRDIYFDENSRNLDFLIPENVKKIRDLISLFDKQQQWLVEGTAATIEKSRKAAPGLLSFSSYYGGARNVVHPLKFSSYTKPTLQIPYQTQDFWSFTSNQNGLGIGLLKHLLDNGKLSDSLEFSDKAIRSLNLEAYPEGLKSAYWEWAKTQAYQWKDP